MSTSTGLSVSRSILKVILSFLEYTPSQYISLVLVNRYFKKLTQTQVWGTVKYPTYLTTVEQANSIIMAVGSTLTYVSCNIDSLPSIVTCNQIRKLIVNIYYPNYIDPTKYTVSLRERFARVQELTIESLVLYNHGTVGSIDMYSLLLESFPLVHHLTLNQCTVQPQAHREVDNDKKRYTSSSLQSLTFIECVMNTETLLSMTELTPFLDKLGLFDNVHMTPTENQGDVVENIGGFLINNEQWEKLGVNLKTLTEMRISNIVITPVDGYTTSFVPFHTIKSLELGVMDYDDKEVILDLSKWYQLENLTINSTVGVRVSIPLHTISTKLKTMFISPGCYVLPGVSPTQLILLRTLTVNGVNLTEEQLTNITQCCLLLQELDCGFNNLITFECSMLPRKKGHNLNRSHLHSIKMCSVCGVTPRGMDNLVMYHPLRTINMGQCHYIPGVIKALSKATHASETPLVNINLIQMKYSSDLEGIFGSTSSIVHMNLDEIYLNLGLATAISQSPHFRRLSVYDRYGFHFESGVDYNKVLKQLTCGSNIQNKYFTHNVKYLPEGYTIYLEPQVRQSFEELYSGI